MSPTPVFSGGGLEGMGLESEKARSFDRQQMSELPTVVEPPGRPHVSGLAPRLRALHGHPWGGGTEERGGFRGLSLSVWK